MADEKPPISVARQLTLLRRWRRLETLFGAAGLGLFLCAILLCLFGLTKYGFYASLIGFEALIPAAAFALGRKRLQDGLQGLGPPAIGPLAESLYFDLTGVAHGDLPGKDPQERAQTVTVLTRLLPEAAPGYLRTLTDTEAESLYRCLEPAHMNVEADLQVRILDHLLQSPDTRALNDVTALSNISAASAQEAATKEKAARCREVLWEVALRERAGEGLLRPADADDSQTLVRPASSSLSDAHEELLRPGEVE